MPNATNSTLCHLPDPRSLAVAEDLQRVAPLPTSVLLCGETGVGKSAWVKFLHRSSPYAELVELPCGDIPENLLESEWFGYKRGAFTGAHSDHEGRLPAAGHNLICLDGIDLLPLAMQAKLLRVLERGACHPLGSPSEVPVRGRFIFTAAADLAERVGAGHFRRDLFYRISAFTIPVTPLRQRPLDILPLLEWFARRHSLPMALDRSGREIVTHYGWPGNIRELENWVTALSIRATRLDDNAAHDLVRQPAAWMDVAQAQQWTLAQVEMEYIRRVLAQAPSREAAAALLGVTRKTLYNKLKKR